MNNKKTFLSMAASLFFLFFAECNMSALGIGFAPYKIEGKLVCGKDSPNYERGALLCSFKNLSENTVSGIYVVFSLFDDECVPLCQNVIEVKVQIESMEDAFFTVNLDKYLPEDVNENYSLDFIYASKIFYKGNTEWSDPLGLKNFL